MTTPLFHDAQNPAVRLRWRVRLAPRQERPDA